MQHLTRRTVIGLLAVALALTSCGGDDGDSTGGDGGAEADSGGSGLDNCSLLTDEEVSAFAGITLQHGDDSPLGCGFTAPGGSVADFSVLYEESGQPLLEAAAELAPNLDLRELMGGDFDEAVAVYDGEEANFLLMRRGTDRVVLVMTFLDVTTDKMAAAIALAETALDRAEAD